MEALGAHFRIVNALLIREMLTKFGGSPGGYIWAIADPLGGLLVLTIAFTAFVRHPPLGESFLMFFASGYMIYAMYSNVANQVSYTLVESQAIMKFPIVAPIDAIIARFYLQAITGIFVIFLVIAPIMMFTNTGAKLNMLPIIAGLIAAGAFGLGVALVNNFLFVKSPIYLKIYSIVSRPLFLVSGVLYIPEAMPTAVQGIIYYNPIAHIVSLFRLGLYPTYDAYLLDLPFLFATTVCPIALGAMFVGFHGRRLTEPT